MKPNYLKARMGVPKKPAQLGSGFNKNKAGIVKAKIGKPKKPGMTGSMGLAPKPGMGAAPGVPAPPVPRLDDSIYQSQLNQLQTGFNDSSLALGQRETGIREQFGFDPQYASNPYTRANMLQRAAQQRFRGTTNSMAGRGQLYSGATNRARSADEFTSGGELDSARREYAESLRGVEADRLAAQRQLEFGSADAYAEMLGRFEEREPDPSLFGGALPPKKQPKKKPKKFKKKGKR